MNNYIKLVNFEVKRFLKLFLVLVTAIVASQITGAIISSFSFLNRVETRMKQEQITESEYILRYDAYSLNNFINSELFALSIMFAATVLLIYVFFIWYRDWLGKSSFIYRLLMLPTERRNVYFAKLTAILLFVLFIVGVEVVLLEVIEQIMRWIVPESLRIDGVITYYSFDVLDIIYPQTLFQFVLIYGLGITLVAIVFTAILFERSYHLKGIFLAGLYMVISGTVMLAPIIIRSNTNYFYNEEIILMMVLCSILAFVAAIFTANYLLKRKINV